MTIFFEIILIVGFSIASYYIGYRYAIDFSPKQDQPYNPVEDLENNKAQQISKSQYQARQKELDKLYIQIKEVKSRQKKTLAEIDLLKAKMKNKPISDQDFNSLLDE